MDGQMVQLNLSFDASKQQWDLMLFGPKSSTDGITISRPGLDELWSETKPMLLACLGMKEIRPQRPSLSARIVQFVGRIKWERDSDRYRRELVRERGNAAT